MPITLVEQEVPDYSHDYYDVTFYEDQIRTLCTACPSMVDSWISETLSIRSQTSHHLIVGLDIEWRPNFGRNFDNPTATLQLCVDHRCLIFKLIHASNFPQSLVDFLMDRSFTFVGVGIGQDVEKLYEDHQLRVLNTADLRDLAVNGMGRTDLRNAGLKELVRVVLGKEINKPRSVTLSRWDYEWLSPSQVQYACLDAFLSSEIGRRFL